MQFSKRGRDMRAEDDCNSGQVSRIFTIASVTLSETHLQVYGSQVVTLFHKPSPQQLTARLEKRVCPVPVDVPWTLTRSRDVTRMERTLTSVSHTNGRSGSFENKIAIGSGDVGKICRINRSFEVGATICRWICCQSIRQTIVSFRLPTDPGPSSTHP